MLLFCETPKPAAAHRALSSYCTAMLPVLALAAVLAFGVTGATAQACARPANILAAEISPDGKRFAVGAGDSRLIMHAWLENPAAAPAPVLRDVDAGAVEDAMRFLETRGKTAVLVAVGGALVGVLGLQDTEKDDAASGRVYYYNTLTGKSQWEHPALVPAGVAVGRRAVGADLVRVLGRLDRRSRRGKITGCGR